MTIMVENTYLGDLVKREADDFFSREKITIKAGEVLSLGEVLGKMLKSIPTTGTADESNTGNGTCTGVAGGSDTKIGDYVLTCINADVSGSEVFKVIDPDGFQLDNATVGVAYESNGINFTLNDDAQDFVVGDKFTISVSAGSKKFVALDLDAVDGSQIAAGFAIKDYAAGTLRSVAFTSGGTYNVVAGDLLEQDAGGAKATVHQAPTVSSGAFNDGDAAGTFILENQDGTFETGTLKVGDYDDVATIGGNSSAYAPDREGVAIVRDAVIDPAYLTWPTGISAAQKAAALAQLQDTGILSDRPAA